MIKVLSVNCRGLKSYQKRFDVINFLKEKQPHILCLQDTHCTDSEYTSIKNIWSAECAINGNKTNSRGVAILLNSNLEYKIINESCDNNGNLICLDLQIDNDWTVRLINIYAPNNDDPDFFLYVADLIDQNPCNYEIICGDLNLTLNPLIDSYNYANINNPKARDQLMDIMQSRNLVDSYRVQNATKKIYTWFRKNPTKMARLDYFIVSSAMMDIIYKSDIIPGYRTDHSIIQITIKSNNFIRGRGLWKFNCSLLKNPEYLELVNKIIDSELHFYAIPLYSYNFLYTYSQSLQLTVSHQLFLDTLLTKIRGETIKFSTSLKKKENLNEQNLINDIKEIENSPSLIQLTDLLQDKKEELEELRIQRIKGQMIRSRIQLLDEGERPTKYFCALENKRYINKTIKVINDNDNLIQNQKTILEHVKNYYSDLFASREHTINDQAISNILDNINIKKLPDSQSHSIEGPITIEELSYSLNKMKTNKTPGSDGYPSEFFKVFWGKLKYLILNAINEGYEKNELSITMRHCVISCLPKGDKPRQFLKNWRPVSLLNVTYKMASAVIASRLKLVLDQIISNTQSGFLSNRYMGETTRLVYDIMNYLEHKNQTGLLVLIDFQKAFDSVSWKFLYKAMEAFNFGPSMIKWVNIFNNNITASIIQYGHLSDPFPIQRGCRQGDPIASYLFLLCAEVLFLLIDGNKDINGIKISGQEYKLAQFADDTTILLDGTQISIQSTLNTLEIFGTISGLKMNTDKTKVIWLGSKKYSKDKYETTPQLLWGATNFDLLGIHFDVDLAKMIPINYNKYTAQLQQTLVAWSKRFLTPIGKITVIKTFAISKLIHLYLTLPLPKDHVTNINKILFSFVWSKKPDKLKRVLIKKSYNNGGLNMLELEKFIQALKLSWIKRLTNSAHNPQWITLFETAISPIHELFTLGSFYSQKIANQTRNNFWSQVLMAWKDFSEIPNIKTLQDLYSEPLWYNPVISDYPFFLKQCYIKSLANVGDNLDKNGNITTRNDIIQMYNIVNLDYLTYFRLSKMAKIAKKKILDKGQSEISQPIRPFYSKNAQLIFCKKKGVKHIYRALVSDSPAEHPKWNNILQTNINEEMWKSIHKLPYHIIKDNYLTYFQFKIINRILGVKDMLYKMKIADNSSCALCNRESETILHLFWECQKAQGLWRQVKDWLHTKLGITLPLDPITIILGYLNKDTNYIPINVIILVTKSYIFLNSQKKRILHITSLIKRITATIQDQQRISISNNRLQTFSKIWEGWDFLF